MSQIRYELEIGIAIKMNKVLFNMEKDSVLIFVYLPPSESPFYKSKTLKGILYLEEQVSDIILNGDNKYMIVGDLNSRCGEQSECVMADGTVPELDDHSDIFTCPVDVNRSSLKWMNVRKVNTFLLR